ncbi:hypothetical protein ZWY2020_026056 [Hordeum vulgare]|nr:hypothetical protein ZWY2020_026056 [Hordeum vulgare]
MDQHLLTVAISSDFTSDDSSSEGGQGDPEMDNRLLKAAIAGDSRSMKEMALQDPSILFGTTPAGNTCLHISCIHGHQVFSTDVVALEDSLLAAVNLDDETPLVAAVRSGCVSLASILLQCYLARGLTEAILWQDIDDCNALHHAIRSGHMELALKLIEAEPALSTHVNILSESPMYIAAMRDFTDISDKLLEIPDSAHVGPWGNNALQAAVRNGNSVLAKRIMETRPWLAREPDNGGNTPLSAAVYRNKIGVVRALLEHDCSLGYEVRRDGMPLLSEAASGGHIDVAQELLNHCPDTPYCGTQNMCWTSLHTAVWFGQVEFTKFILRTPILRKLVNMQDVLGKTALHYAVHRCNPKMVAALLSHQDIDTTVLDNNGVPPAWELLGFMDNAKALNWNEMIMLMLRADPRDATSLYNLHTRIKQNVTEESRSEAKSLTQTYTIGSTQSQAGLPPQTKQPQLKPEDIYLHQPRTEPPHLDSNRMELAQWASFLSVMVATMLLLRCVLTGRGGGGAGGYNLPPGPKPWPIIGNLNLISTLPHRSIHALSRQYGPLMQLRFGAFPVVVGSSAKMAKFFLKTHDVAFTDRPKTAAGKYTTYNYTDITWSPYGAYWRQARKMCVTQLFSAKRLESYKYIRSEEVLALVRDLYAGASRVLVLKDYLSMVNLNVITRMVLGKKYLEEEVRSVAGTVITTPEEFKWMLDELFFLNGVFNIGDSIPWLNWMDLQGYVKRMKKLSKRFDQFLEHVVYEHSERRRSEGQSFVSHDMVDVLLQYASDPGLEVKLNRESVKAFTQDLIAAGTESSAVTVEWAMC